VSNLRNLPWTKFGFEGVLIVLSILAAFWIDAWWNDQQRAVEEKELLKNLKVEFELNIRLLSARKSNHESNRLAAQRLLSISGPDSESEGYQIEIVREDMLRMLQWWTYNPQTGAVNGTIQSGKLGVISSNELRTRLAYWPAQLQDFSEDELFLAEFTKDSVYPLLQTLTTMRNFVSMANVDQSAFSEGFADVLTSREFENVVIQKLAMTEEIMDIYDEIGDEIAGTLALLEKEIQRQ
jgi:hypothetical protein